MTAQTLSYGDERIRYRVRFAPASRRKLAIHVLPDGEVWVEVPDGTSLALIKQSVARRARWLSEHLQAINRRRVAVLPREYVSGESHYYLGRRYLLKLRQSSVEPPSVALRQGRFQVVAASCDTALVRALMRDWYRRRARLVFEAGLAAWVGYLPWLDEAPCWKLVAMKRQWGSCSPKGTLSLNPHLIKAPRRCIDYVLLHELCHLRFPNHQQGFHRLLLRHMPAWKEAKRTLDEMAEQLLSE
ncbi:MAG: M48 family metallopeptidase [Pseudomarimonas sp.]